MNRILVVDDNVDILDVLKIAFEVRGYEVSLLHRGEEVNETVRSFKPDVILLDVLLGSTNGVDICKELKATAEHKHIPVIIYSAHLEVDHISRICPADAFLKKPFNIKDLLAVVAGQLAGK